MLNSRTGDPVSRLPFLLPAPPLLPPGPAPSPGKGVSSIWWLTHPGTADRHPKERVELRDATGLGSAMDRKVAREFRHKVRVKRCPKPCGLWSPWSGGWEMDKDPLPGLRALGRLELLKLGGPQQNEEGTLGVPL